MYDNVIAQKIAKQYNQQPLTDFVSIKPETDLETLNLNWRESDLPEYKRTKHVHRLHPYLGKFIPQLVEIFLRKYKPTLVYDPFAVAKTVPEDTRRSFLPELTNEKCGEVAEWLKATVC